METIFKELESDIRVVYTDKMKVLQKYADIGRELSSAIKVFEEAKAEAYTSGLITGKNEAERDAQITKYCSDAKTVVMAAEQRLAAEKTNLAILDTNLQRIDRLMALMELEWKYDNEKQA